MRIDKFLKVSRVIKRRTVANAACSNGRVIVNDKVVKSSYEVKLDDIVQVKFGDNVLKFKVVSLVERTKENKNIEMIQII